MAIVKNIKKDEPLKLIPWLDEAGEMEKQDREEAVKEYKKIAAVYPLNEKVYDRLMILYRQLKMPKEELLWINKAIRTFEEKFKTATSEAFCENCIHQQISDSFYGIGRQKR